MSPENNEMLSRGNTCIDWRRAHMFLTFLIVSSEGPVGGVAASSSISCR